MVGSVYRSVSWSGAFFLNTYTRGCILSEILDFFAYFLNIDGGIDSWDG